MKKRKFNLSGPIAIVIALLILAIFVPINLIVSYYDKVYDMTPEGKYTLNDKTVQLLDETSDKEIDIYFLSKLQYLQDAPEFLPLYHTLTKLDARDNIKLTCFDPDENTALSRLLDPTGTIGTSEADVFVRYHNKDTDTDVIKKIDHSKIFQSGADGIDYYAGEELIAGAIKICTSGSLPTIYFLTGHGEKSVGEPISIEDIENDQVSEEQLKGFTIYANQIRAKNYNVEELNLDEAGAIPDNAAIIYIAGPQKDITNKEKALLDTYLENGGSVSFLIPPCETGGRFTNIEALLAEFGLGMDYNIVSESLPVNQLYDREGQQSPYFMRVQYTPATDDFTEDLTTDLNILVSEGGYTAGISNTRSFYELPDTAYVGASYIEKSSIIRNVPDSTGTAYTTESKSMGGDSESAAEADKELNNVLLDFGFYSYNKMTGGKIIVFGTTDMIDAELVSPSVNGTGTLALFSNTWLHDSDIEMGIGNKISHYDSMTFKTKAQAEKTLALIVIVPVAVAVIGVIVWLKRRHA